MAGLARLQSDHPHLYAAVRAASPAGRRACALACVERAVATTGLDDAAVIDALATLRAGEPLGPEAKQDVLRAANAHDEEYFRLWGQRSKKMRELAIAPFGRARAATASLFAADGNGESCDEVLYEALMTTDDQGVAVETALRALSER